MKKTALKDLVSKHGELSRVARGLNISHQLADTERQLTLAEISPLSNTKTGKWSGLKLVLFPFKSH